MQKPVVKIFFIRRQRKGGISPVPILFGMRNSQARLPDNQMSFSKFSFLPGG